MHYTLLTNHRQFHLLSRSRQICFFSHLIVILYCFMRRCIYTAYLYLFSTLNPRLLPSLSFLPSCHHHELPVRTAGCGGVLLKPAHATINVATAYVPAGVPSEPLHPGARLVLNPRSGVLDTVSRSHFDRSRVTARLKSRLALALGLVFSSRFPSRLERPA